MNHLYIFAAVLFTVYGQVAVKWQMSAMPPPPPDLADKFVYLARLMLAPKIISGFAAAFLAALGWIMAMSKFDISYAYPFMSLAFILVPLAGIVFFGEQLTTWRIVGSALIVLGVVVATRGESRTVPGPSEPAAVELESQAATATAALDA